MLHYTPFDRRASCSAGWNTTEGGPCVLRPTKPNQRDSPNPLVGAHRCFQNFVNGKCTNKKTHLLCKNVVCHKNRTESGAKVDWAMSVFDTPWNASEMGCGFGGVGGNVGLGGVGKCKSKAAMWRQAASWNNGFAFPWEVGMYHNLTGNFQ